MPSIEYANEPFKTLAQLRSATKKFKEQSPEWYVAGWVDYFIYKERVKLHIKSKEFSVKLLHIRQACLEHKFSLPPGDFEWLKVQFMNWLIEDIDPKLTSRYRKYLP